MPIAAKFSEAFYEKFGHQATGELVDYLNTVDGTYRSELERLNDTNWARFEARLEQRATMLEALIDRRAAELETRIERMDARIDRLDTKVDQRLAELKAELVKWIFLFWLGTIGIVLGLQKL